MSLQSRELSCVRGHRILFDHLDFELDAGRILLVEGSNGSGKTSLLKMLTGLRPPDSGEILWNGNNIHSLGPDYRENMAWLGHSNGIKEDLTAVENLRMALALNHGNGRKINDALEMVNLRAHKNALPRLFSAGMKRRLALAKLLLVKAPLWILDEPQAALDKTGIAMFEAFVHEHVQQGGMVVMTSHHDVGLQENYLIKLRLSA